MDEQIYTGGRIGMLVIGIIFLCLVIGCITLSIVAAYLCYDRNKLLAEKKDSAFLIRSVNHWQHSSVYFMSRVDSLKKQCIELQCKLNHMRQSKIFWKNRCRSLELKIKEQESKK